MQKVLETFNKETMRRFHSGDHRAFIDVFTLLYEDGVKWANSCLYNKCLISSRRITAEALFMSFGKLKYRDFTEIGQIKSFVVVTIRNSCKSYLRAKETRPGIPYYEIDSDYYKNLPTMMVNKLLAKVE